MIQRRRGKWEEGGIRIRVRDGAREKGRIVEPRMRSERKSRKE